jgi:hypothetical protein
MRCGTLCLLRPKYLIRSLHVHQTVEVGLRSGTGSVAKLGQDLGGNEFDESAQKVLK